MSQVRRILAPGEWVIYQYRRSDGLWLPWALAILAAFLLRPLVAILELTLEASEAIDLWACAVTNRRVLVRHGVFGRRYLDMPLAEIADVRYEGPRRRLVFVAVDYALQVKCRQEFADRILDALDKARESASA